MKIHFFSIKNAIQDLKCLNYLVRKNSIGKEAQG